MNIHNEKLGRHLKLMLPKYRPDPVSRLEHIPERLYSTELKPIVGSKNYNQLRVPSAETKRLRLCREALRRLVSKRQGGVAPPPPSPSPCTGEVGEIWKTGED